ncbi:Hsp70 family protein [Myxococcota bacterium]|nr:Hsp70 family protein [Myxococcota bacterium]
MASSHSGWVLGIDLGTTNTSAVVYAPDRPGPISIMHGRNAPVMPSVVSLKNPDLPLVGWLAKDMLLTDPLTTIHGWKRFIGRSERSEYVSRHRDRFPFRIQTDAKGRLGAVVHGRVVSFVEIAALVLDQVRLQTAAAVRSEVRDAVIAVPAHFVTAQREAIKEAAQLAGLEVLQLVNEPTAAALAFGVERHLDSRILIYDLGGGTFDATILELTGDVFDVKATRGDGFLGGIDFDRAVMKRLVDHLGSRYLVDVTEEPVVAQRILGAAENAKIELSQQPSARIHVPMIGVDRRGDHFDLDYRLTRDELEELTAPLVERTMGTVDEMMQSQGYKPRDVQHVLLVGGQTRMPLVRRRIEAYFGKSPLAILDPDTCVAHGAALVAKSHGDLGGAVLIDVLSVPIGVVFPGGQTRFVFEANRRLPATTTLQLQQPPGQRGLVVGLWQGPDITSSERQVLGVLKVPANVFESSPAVALELRLGEDLRLSAKVLSALGSQPLILESGRA